MNYIKLSDVALFVRNGANIKQDKQCKTGIPITRIETISNDKFNYDKFGYANIQFADYSDYYLQNQDILMSHINSTKFLGRCVLFENNPFPIIHGMNLLCIRFKKDAYVPSYFVWYTKSNIAKDYIRQHTKCAVNQASITASDIRNMPIPLIDNSAQNNVISVLNGIDFAIKQLEKRLFCLDELVKSQFILQGVA